MSYSSIIINSGTASVGSAIGLKIPTTLGDIKKDKKYVLQFKARTLNTSQILNNIYIGSQKLSDVDIKNFQTISLDSTTFYDCHVAFTANSDMNNPSVTIGSIKTSSDSNNLDIFEITELGLFQGTENKEYNPSVSDIQVIKREVTTMIEQLVDCITLKAERAEMDSLSNKISDALGQIQVSAGEIELKVGRDNIISSINMTPETIKINTNLLDLSGDMDLQGTFKCYKSKSDKSSNYLHMTGAMVFGYNEVGGQYPVFASGLWTDENMGYFSTGYTRADVSDANGCIWISPQQGNNGGQLTFSRLIGSDIKFNSIYFNKDGEVLFDNNIYSNPVADNVYPYIFNGGVSVASLKCNNLRTQNIYPTYTGGLDIGSPTLRYRDIFADSVSTTNYEMKIGTIKSGGSWETYGPLFVCSSAGYVYPQSNGALGLGTGSLRFYGINLVNSPNVSSDRRMKTDIHYLNNQDESEIINGRSTININITTKDMRDFIKDDLQLASYRYNNNIDRENTSVDYGFIAQDILYTKVGSEIVQLEDKNDLDSNLSYNQNNYISTIAGALQEEIKIRDEQIASLEDKIAKLEKLVENLIEK